jgi:P pilus assembly chaperone PapD
MYYSFIPQSHLFNDLLHLRLVHIRRSNLKLIGLCLLVASVLVSGAASAKISISSKRIYLDNNSSTDNFVITNRGLNSQKCQLITKHYTFDEFGSMTAYTGKELPAYAAESIMRFSPKSFQIEANKKQTVRFTLRRKKNIEPMEHRAYLLVDCEKMAKPNSLDNNSDDGIANISFTPKVLHNVPIIVRPTLLNASVDFSNVTLDSNILSFYITRKGSRSIFAKVTLTERSNGKKISHSNPFAIYTETRLKNFKMAIPEGHSLADIVITLNEMSEYGGNINQSWPVIKSGE